jgi:GR25 family glycosyltransferase involved in LPS biosynthesis
MAFPIYVINLDRDKDRFAKIAQQVADWPLFGLTRIPGVSGSELPRAARYLLAGQENWADRKGEVGCFLSHVKAWEAVASGVEPSAIIVEDDARFRNLSLLGEVVIPADADLIFLNDRMSPGDRYGTLEVAPIVVSVHAAINHLGGNRGVGGDGYLLTRGGAEKLIGAVSHDHCYGHVDWRLLRYSLQEADVEGVVHSEELRWIIRHHHNPLIPPAWGVIKAYCLSEPLIAHGGVDSTRVKENL